MGKGLCWFFPCLAGWLFLSVFSSPVLAATQFYLLTEPLFISPIVRGSGFLSKTFTIDYQQGEMILSSNPDGTGSTVVDDALRLRVKHPDGTQSLFTWYYEMACTQLYPLPPKDLTNLFRPGQNQVTLSLFDKCGVNASSSYLYLVNLHAPDSGPEPFLRLPWDYPSHGLSFSEAALRMTAYFDHAYPLLSVGGVLSEPYRFSEQVTNFEGKTDSSFQYSSHDGYDYARSAKALLGEPLLAAADGCATYHYQGATGHAIYINHRNFYQTRYYHLLPEGLITQSSDPGQCVEVAQGQAVGKIGFSGNVIPPGVNGAHIHFMVIEDKNRDGNFEDNLPDGVVDPFGWQAEEPDPWEQFSFTFGSQDRTGAKSYYLWQEPLGGKAATLVPNQETVVEIEKAQVTAPVNLAASGSILKLALIPQSGFSNALSEIWRSLGSVLEILVVDPQGNPLSQFDQPLTINLLFTDEDLSLLDPTSLQIFSSADGEQWQPEPTQIDWANHQATTQVNHLSHFALMAKLKDTVPPNTQALPYNLSQEPPVQVQKAPGYAFPVKITLEAQDDQDDSIEEIWYRLGEESWQLYGDPLVFEEEGSFRLEYFAVDESGNAEEIRIDEFVLDFQPPEALIQLNLETGQEEITCLDATECEVTLNTAQGKTHREYRLTDKGGNWLIIKGQKTNNSSQSNFVHKFHWQSLESNWLSPTSFPQVWVSFKQNNKNKKDELIQEASGSEDRHLEAVYVFDADTTLVRTFIGNTLQNEEEKLGQVPLRLTSRNGQVEVGY